jgi:murein DD-endopeptidase MepM/ murein hydrolase activator NlpD
VRSLRLLLTTLALAPGALAQQLPPLPDSTGWGVHILALGRGPDGAVWAGTYGDGIFVLRPGANAWDHVRADDAPVQAFAFGPRGDDVWFGTAGHGWGLSRDGGHTWRTWDAREVGPKWQYVAPNGIALRGDTVFVGTTGGIRYTREHGALWGTVADSGPGALPSPYVLTLAAARDTGLWVSTLKGFGQWRPRAPFQPMDPSPVPILGPRVRAIFVVRGEKAVVPVVLGGEQCLGSLRPKRRQEPAAWQCVGMLMRGAPPEGRVVRDLGGCDGIMCAGATSSGAIRTQRMLGFEMYAPEATARSRDIYAVLPPVPRQPGDTLFGTACGFLRAQPEACLMHGDTIGVKTPAPLPHDLFARPIAPTDQPFIDQTARYGAATAAGEEPGVAFEEPQGTTVLAIGAGVVVHAGPAEQGGLVVAIRHDTTVALDGRRMVLFSTYAYNARLLVTAGEHVARGQPIAKVGSAGRATREHLRLEVHVAPTDDPKPVVDPTRFPPYAANPELWIDPLPGTGVVAGQVWDAEGRAVSRARIYGLVKPEPQEAPFSYAESYGDRARADPVLHEHFAVSDVPAGEYDVGVTIGGKKVIRHVVVEAGKLTWVEFRP